MNRLKRTLIGIVAMLLLTMSSTACAATAPKPVPSHGPRHPAPVLPGADNPSSPSDPTVRDCWTMPGDGMASHCAA